MTFPSEATVPPILPWFATLWQRIYKPVRDTGAAAGERREQQA